MKYKLPKSGLLRWETDFIEIIPHYVSPNNRVVVHCFYTDFTLGRWCEDIVYEEDCLPRHFKHRYEASHEI